MAGLGVVTRGFGTDGSIVTRGFGSSIIEAVTEAVDTAVLRGKRAVEQVDRYREYVETYIIKATLLEVNKKELTYPISKKITRFFGHYDNIVVSAIIKWTKKVNLTTSNILIKASRIFSKRLK